MEEYEKLIKRHSESVNQSHRSFVSPVKPDKRASLTIPPSNAVTNCYMNDRCMYFDFGVNQDGSDPNVVYLYEVYEDEAALQEHRDSSHLKEYLSAAAELTDSHDVRTLNLAPYGSVNCNYAGQCEIGEGMWD
jgi:quinol monooxygenase YgiN